VYQFAAAEQAGLVRREELKYAARPGEVGRLRLTLSAPDVRCGQCVATIKRARHKLPEVASARVNLATRRINVTMAAQDFDPLSVVEVLRNVGCRATAADPGAPVARASSSRQRLLSQMAVAGLALLCHLHSRRW
jgi:Cu2+-exporting ATPase